MNIAVFVKGTHFHKVYGGLETQNRALCEGLASRGHSITVFTPQKEIAFTEKQEHGVKYVFVPCKFKMGLIFGFFGTLDPQNWFNKSYLAFKQAHSVKPFNVVLSQSSAAYGIIRRKSQFGIKIVSVSHGTILSEYQTYFDGISNIKDILKLASNTAFAIKNFFTRQRETIHGADKVIAVSNFVKQALIDETFVSPDKITVIFNGIDSSSFSSSVITTKPEEPVNLIFVGRMVKSKGIFDILEMARDPLFEGTKFTLIGDGEDLPRLKQKIIDFKLTDKFVLPGWQNSQQVTEQLKQAHVFIFPTKRVEGFPMTLVEAMLAGLPIVGFDMGGVVDAIEDRKTGYLIKAGHLEAFRSRVLELVLNAKKRNEMAQASIDRAKKDFTIDIMLNKYEELLKE